jgi:lysophospholipase L1-like esterase
MVAQDWANIGQFSNENEVLRASQKPIEAVFMGNSITQGWVDMHPEFFALHGFVNRGIGGQTTPQMLLRFRSDVIELAPKRVVLLAGINDIAENTGPIALEDVFGNLKSMAELAVANGIVPVLCSVLPANEFPWRPEIVPTEKVIQLNQWIQNYCQELGFTYVDYYNPMVNDSYGLRSDLGYDTVHPNSNGYDVMEAILLRAFLEAAE